MSSSSLPGRLGIAAVVAIVVAAVVVAIQLLGGAAADESGGTTPPRAVPGPTGFEAVVDQALPSVVQITTERGLGSGVSSTAPATSSPTRTWSPARGAFG